LKILIREAVGDIGDIFESRIQKIVDPSWKKSFIEIDDPTGVGTIKDRLFDYAVLSAPEYWSPNLFPLDPSSQPSGVPGWTNNINLAGMSYLGPDKKYMELPADPNLGPSGPSWPIGYLTNADGEWQSGVNFNTIDDFLISDGWPTRKFGGDLPWSGGLFFQPYLKIKSQIIPQDNFPDELGVATQEEYRFAEAMTIFWTKFKQAWVNYWPFPTQNDIPIKAIRMDYAGDKYEMYDMAHKTIDAMIDFIDEEGVAPTQEELQHVGFFGDPDHSGLGATFKQFFMLFFAPRSSQEDRPERYPFTRLVSSYMQKHDHGKYGDATPNFPLFPSSMVDGPKNTYYYWEQHQDGAPMAARWHWANRGTVSINLASSGQPSLGAPDLLIEQPNPTVAATYKLTNVEKWKSRYKSTPALFGHTMNYGSPSWSTVGTGVLSNPFLEEIQNFLLGPGSISTWNTTGEQMVENSQVQDEQAARRSAAAFW